MATEPTDLEKAQANCTEAFNAMSQAFIRFSLAYVAMERVIDEIKHPTIFDDKEST